MKVWGCLAYVKIILSEKLKAKYDKCLFVGYPKETMGYQFYNSFKQKVFISKHVVFLEKEFLLRDSGSKVELEEVQHAQAETNQLPEPEAIIHRDEIIVDPSNDNHLVNQVEYVLFQGDMDFSLVNRMTFCS